MTVGPIGESFRLGVPYTAGWFRIRLNEKVRMRYQKRDAIQDGYEFVIDTYQQLRVKRARKDGLLLSWLEGLWCALFARFAIVTTQPFISNMAASLILLDDVQLEEAEVWRLLTYDIEWRVESAEDFYRHFLATRSLVCEYDVLAAIAGDIRADTLHILQRQRGSSAPLEALAHALLDPDLVTRINQRIACTGIKIRRFYPPAAAESLQEERRGQRECAILATMTQLCMELRSDIPLSPGLMTADDAMRATIVRGLLGHLCQELSPAKAWLEQVWRACGFEIAFDELRGVLADENSPTANTTQVALPLHVVQRLKQAGIEKLRLANKTTPQEHQRRSNLRHKAQSYLKLALLLSDALSAIDISAARSLRIELVTILNILKNFDQKRIAHISFPSGSTVHLMAVAAEGSTLAGGHSAGAGQSVHFVHEILPLAEQTTLRNAEAVTVWTPAAAAQKCNFTGSDEEISLTLQVLEPNGSAAESAAEIEAAILASEPAVFWTWKVRANRERFAVRLRSTPASTVHEVEIEDAEFINLHPARSLHFPEVPHIRLAYEPLEIALLIDGYWLADDGSAHPKRRTGLDLLVDLLDRLDEIENETKRGLLFHAVICLDEHISPQFLRQHGPIPSLYALDEAPVETTAQLVAEWLQPWVERWQRWEVKPYPVDTDIALEKGLRYLNHLQWQRTTRADHRAVLSIGRSRPHEHARYFANGLGRGEALTGNVMVPHAIPYEPDDRFSVTDIDWREELNGLRQRCATILALSDPGLPNPSYDLPTTHPLYREYQGFWATLDPQILLDISDSPVTYCAEMGVDRVLQTLEEHLFRKRAMRYCEPALVLPLSQSLASYA